MTLSALHSFDTMPRVVVRRESSDPLTPWHVTTRGLPALAYATWRDAFDAAYFRTLTWEAGRYAALRYGYGKAAERDDTEVTR